MPTRTHTHARRHHSFHCGALPLCTRNAHTHLSSHEDTTCSHHAGGNGLAHASPRCSVPRPFELRIFASTLHVLFQHARQWLIACTCDAAARAHSTCTRYRSHFGSRYKLGCCGHAGLFMCGVGTTSRHHPYIPRATGTTTEAYTTTSTRIATCQHALRTIRQSGKSCTALRVRSSPWCGAPTGRLQDAVQDIPQAPDDTVTSRNGVAPTTAAHAVVCNRALVNLPG